jgi:hypothetical protein
MKLSPFFLPFLGLLLFASCDRNALDPEPVIEAPLEALHYDGPVNTAPVLQGGSYEAAVKFNPGALAEYANKPLVEVFFFFLTKPSSTTVKIYEGSDATGEAPGALVYSAAVSTEVESSSWNRHVLKQPLTIDASKDLWISIKFASTNQAQVIGCDEGPGHPLGDFLFDSDDGEFQRFLVRSNGEANINWNIRGVVDPS